MTRSLFAAALLTTGLAHAQGAPLRIELPAGALDKSLNRLATQAGVQILFASDATSTLRAPAISGELAVRDALDRLIAGSGLRIHSPAEGIYTVTVDPAAPAPSSRAIELAPVSIEGTVVSASGFEQAIADAPASISVVSREELEKKSYTSVTDAVRNIPGLYVTGGGGMQDISVRGFAPTYTLYLIDGRPVSAGRNVNTNGNDGGKQIGLPPLSQIERIEVVRGPMSSLYGSEAMGGVINIITRDSGDEWSGTLATEYTRAENDVSSDRYLANVFAGGALVPGLLGMQVNTAYQATDESEFQSVSGSSSESTPESTQRRIGTKLILTPNETDEIGLGYETASLEYTHTPGLSIAEDAMLSTYRYDKDVYTLSHDGEYERLLLSSYLQHDVSDKVQDATKKEEVTIFNTQGTYFASSHFFTFGGQYKLEEFVDETNGLLTSDIPGAVRSVDRWIGAVFVEAEWNIVDKLSITTGLRYNDDELFGGELTPRVYAVYRATENFNLKGGVSTGYRQPTLSSATAGFGRGTGGGGSPAPHPRALIIGNPDLKPETSTNYEFGYVYDRPEIGLSTSLVLFHTDYEDKIAEDRFCESEGGGDRDDPSTWTCAFGGNNYLFLSTQKNIDDAEIQGVEFSLDYALTPALRLSASYTYTASEQKSGEFAGEPLNKIPKNMANVSFDWQASALLTAWAQANYRGRTSDFLSRTSMSSGTPGYTFVDAGIVYRVTPTADLKAGLYNLANKEVTNETYGVVLDGRRVVVGLTVDF